MSLRGDFAGRGPTSGAHPANAQTTANPHLCLVPLVLRSSGLGGNGICVHVFLARQVQCERPVSEAPQVVRKPPRRPGSETNKESSSGNEGVSHQGAAV